MADRRPAYQNFYRSCAWALLILLVSSIPGDFIPAGLDIWGDIGPDKILHLFLFGIFSFLMMRDLFRFRPEALKPLNVISIILIGMVFGIFTETLQRFFIPGRSGNVLDLAADAAGIIAGWLFFQMVFKKEIRGIKKKLYLRNP